MEKTNWEDKEAYKIEYRFFIRADDALQALITAQQGIQIATKGAIRLDDIIVNGKSVKEHLSNVYKDLS